MLGKRSVFFYDFLRYSPTWWSVPQSLVVSWSKDSSRAGGFSCPPHPTPPPGEPFGEQAASVCSMGWAGERQRLQLVCPACKLSESILKSTKCQIHEPIYRSGGRRVKWILWLVTHRLPQTSVWFWQVGFNSPLQKRNSNAFLLLAGCCEA